MPKETADSSIITNKDKKINFDKIISFTPF
jgi:hypothetical protein